MPLTAGQFLTHYEILGPLGAGGMGEVYRARDTRLEREVAIKVLPEHFANVRERLKRFEREARALASLNHPNVAGIHGIDRVDDTWFLAMELVPGEDLAARLARGKLPVEEAIDVCRQIAEGLEAAHEAGVVHRDLKPANVRVTPEGVVKILDFGLAKPIRPEAAKGGASTAEPDTFPLTSEGLVLGTPTYMSPEQVRGKPVDRRTDIWAFGCVLYECVTGARAFGGSCVAEILAAVLEGEWDRRALPAATPPHLRELLERCLDRDVRQRLRDAGEARICLEAGSPASPARVANRLAPMALTALVLATFVAGLLVGWFWPHARAAPTLDIRPHQRLTEFVGMEEMPAVSPEENFLAFIHRVDGRRQIFVRGLTEGGASKRITGGANADHSFPHWVDESTLIYYRDQDDGDGSLWQINILTQEEKRIGPAQGEADVSREGRRIATFRTDAEGPALILIDDGDQEIEEAIPLPPGVYSFPRWSPDGESIAFQVRSLIGLSSGEIRVMHIESRETRTIVGSRWTRGLSWLPDGSGLVYASSEGSTMAYPPTFGLRTVRWRGGLRDLPIPQSDARYASYLEPDVTRSGRVVASRIQMESDIYRYPVSGSPRENVENAERITRQTGLVQTPTASPDDEEVAYLWDNGGHANVWISRVDGSEPPRQVTFEQDPRTIVGIPVWNPKRDLIVYVKQSGGVVEQWLVDPDGDERRPLVVTGGSAFWSHDGAWLYCLAAPPAAGATWSTVRHHLDTAETLPVGDDMVGLMITSDGSTGYFSPSTARVGEVWSITPVEGGVRKPLRTDLGPRVPLLPHEYALSPNDDWLATPLVDRGTTNLWLISTRDGELKPITDFQDEPTLICREVSWSSDGKHIFAALTRTSADIVLLDTMLP